MTTYFSIVVTIISYTNLNRSAITMSETLFLIDTFSLIFQVFHGIAPMTGPQGEPTNATFGFTRDIQNLIRDHKPDHLICALESTEPAKRKEYFPEYKANRSAMPDDLRPQIAMILEVIEGFNIPIINSAGWEADDVIATLATQGVEQGLQVIIVTTDKDARQLLGPNVKLYNIRKNEFMDEAGLMDVWGIQPNQAIDFQAMVGDTSDNVPGVPLVGPKKAQTLLQEIGTLDEILANPQKARGKKLQENLSTFAEQARVSRELVTLKTDLPIQLDQKESRISSPNRSRLLELFQQFGFRRFAEDMQKNEVAADSSAAIHVEPRWEVVDTDKKFTSFLKDLSKQTSFCLDLETTSLQANEADIVGWAICWEPSVAWYLPVDAPPGQPTLNAKTVADALRPLLEDPEILISNQNIKYDMIVLRRAGIFLEGVHLDPMVGDYLLDVGARSHSLEALSQKYLQHTMIPISELIGKKGERQKKMFEVDVDKAAEYAAEDADIAFRLALIIEEQLKQESLWDLYWDLERPLISVLVEMEANGIKVDKEILQSQSKTVNTRLLQLVDEIYEIAGHEFNIASPKQLRVVLFEELELPVQKKTKTGPSTDVDVLEKLAKLHPLPEKIMEHRQLSKLKGTYLDALPKMINPETGSIHCSFNQVVAATGRLSSSNPNLQNIPIRTTEGRNIRKAFIPSQPNWKLISADYSQVELRVLAHLSGDQELTAAFERGDDIHTAVASQVFHVDADEVDANMRRVAKAVNFGVVYGQSAYGLSATIGISQDEAAEFIRNYFTLYSGVTNFMKQTLKECRTTGYASTIMGRRRPINGIRPEYHQQFIMPERTAINTVVQGSAADLIKKAMIQLHQRLLKEQSPGRMLLQIHDELVLEAPADKVNDVAKIVREEMESAMELTVPLVVDLSIADNWYEAK